MIICKSIKVPIFEFKINVELFDDIKEVQTKYPQYCTGGVDAFTLEFPGYSQCSLIIPYNNYNCIIHELEHVKNIIWKTKGYRPQADNDEIDAYLMGWLFQKVKDIIDKHCNK